MQVLRQMFNCVRLAAGQRTEAVDATDHCNGAINQNQLIFDEVKTYKSLCQVFGQRWWCDSYFRQ